MSKVLDFCYFWDYLHIGGIPIGTLNHGDVIRDIGVKVDDAMNDANSSICIGTIADAELFVRKSDIVPTVYGDYRVPEARENTGDQVSLYAFIRPSDSVRGHGSIYYSIVRRLQ